MNTTHAYKDLYVYLENIIQIMTVIKVKNIYYFYLHMHIETKRKLEKKIIWSYKCTNYLFTNAVINLLKVSKNIRIHSNEYNVYHEMFFFFYFKMYKKLKYVLYYLCLYFLHLYYL